MSQATDFAVGREVGEGGDAMKMRALPGEREVG